MQYDMKHYIGEGTPVMLGNWWLARMGEGWWSAV